MAIREIITYPDPVLRQKAKPVTVFDEELKTLVTDMGETMYDAPGIGLAANQVGVSLRVIVVDVSQDENEKRFSVFINPEIIRGEGEISDEEGCLSVLEYTARVKRFQRIHVKAQDLDGKYMEFDAEDRFARVLQHEIDHLEGKLFIDRISGLKRNLYKKKLKKILREHT
jgi:peptide deformylase